MNNKDVTAKWARETANNQLGAKADKELSDCLIKVKSAVAQNKLSVTCYNSVEDVVIKELESRGFKLANGYDQRDGGWIKISW